jgi:hypothetical protein
VADGIANLQHSSTLLQILEFLLQHPLLVVRTRYQGFLLLYLLRKCCRLSLHSMNHVL